MSSVFQPLQKQIWVSARQSGVRQLKAGSDWALQQPVTQWAVKELYKAGNRELKARNALSYWLGSSWSHTLMACHTQLQTIATALPAKWPLTRHAKTVTQQWANRFKRQANNLSNQKKLRHMIGSVTFKGLLDTVFYAGGIKGALIALHFWPGSPLHVLSPLAMLYALRAGALAGPTYQRAQHQWRKLDAATLKQAQAKWHALMRRRSIPGTSTLA
jgi:hypothetical protein